MVINHCQYQTRNSLGHVETNLSLTQHTYQEHQECIAIQVC